DPTADEVAKAVKQIGYDPVIERDKRYPRSWWRNEGRVRVEEVDDSKRDVLRAAAVYLQAMREDE
ncbi:MAG: signal recognition particle subunit SRP19/SEC65 family protein, partial [Halobacteria archaeon]|nr:signal recognition particle subunit SRP19/SEC65 family protein [Halobacteria archaeon]